jgi:hypothetical protein
MVTRTPVNPKGLFTSISKNLLRIKIKNLSFYPAFRGLMKHTEKLATNFIKNILTTWWVNDDNTVVLVKLCVIII